MYCVLQCSVLNEKLEMLIETLKEEMTSAKQTEKKEQKELKVL